MRLLKLKPSRRNEIANILHDPDARNNSRLWLLGYLASAGYSQGDIKWFFIVHDKECSTAWNDYSQKHTLYQVDYFFNRHGYNLQLKRNGVKIAKI